MEESSDKYHFVKDIAGESGRWSCYHQVVFYDPREDSDNANKEFDDIDLPRAFPEAYNAQWWKKVILEEE